MGMLNLSATLSVLTVLLMQTHHSEAYHIRRHDSSSAEEETHRQNVRLIQNPFLVLVQNSIPTSAPLTQQSNNKNSIITYKEKSPQYILPKLYQADEANLPWALEPTEALPAGERDQMWECKKSCPYGFQTDVEGREICKCYEPCDGVKCFGGSTCEVDRQCVFDSCSFKAICKEPEDVCSLPKPKYTFMCDKLSKRYYFDTKKGRCRKFWGCAAVEGNSFESKKECKRECYNKDQLKRDREDRKNRKDGRDSSSLVIEPEIHQKSQEEIMSNHIPQIDEEQVRYQNQLDIEKVEETNNRVDTADHQSAFADIFNREMPGLNQLSGCPENKPYEICPFDPCAGCSSSNIMCFTSFCGKCQAIYIDLRTGEASDKFASIC